MVLDNLNTHSESSLGETLGEEKAQKIMNNVEFHFTPVHGSWLDRQRSRSARCRPNALDDGFPARRRWGKSLKPEKSGETKRGAKNN